MAVACMESKKVPDRVIRMELISYFSQYAHDLCTCEQVALRLGRNVEQVRRQMESLVELGILGKSSEGDRCRYRYLPPVCGGRAGTSGRQLEMGPPLGRTACAGAVGAARKSEGEQEGESEVRLHLLAAALEREGWKECLELLADTIYKVEGTPCAAYLLGERCSELLWDCQRGTNGTKAGMSKVSGVQNMVIEGELIREKGLLETAHHIKYLYAVDESESILVCANRNGSYHVDACFLKSLCADILPVAAEKRRLDHLQEKAAEKLLQESIYWNTAYSPDVSRSLEGALASAAKSIGASRVALLVEDGGGMLRTLSTYGLRGKPLGPGGSFRVGEGVAGWCVQRGSVANLANPRVDPRFICNDYDDIDSMLCCPIVHPDGKPMGAICAVNKGREEEGSRARFDIKDERLLEGIARALASALLSRSDRTKVLSRSVIQSMLSERPS